MRLNDQVQNLQFGDGNRMFVFKDGVNYKYMSGEDLVFRLAPAHDPTVEDAAISWMPYILSDNALTDWAVLLQISRFVGHGKGGFGTRQDLLSLRSFGDENTYCPCYEIARAISQMSQDWGYLMSDSTTPDKKTVLERKAFGKPVSHMVANILDLNQATAGMRVGCFTTSATQALIDPKSGIAYQRNANAIDAEALKANYLSGYAMGDLTHPETGPGLMLSKEKAKGNKFSKYVVSLALDPQRNIIRRPLTPELMAARHYMNNPDSFLNIPTEQDLVDMMVHLLNMRSPSGFHEHALLREVFPNFNVPEPPAAAAATPTIQSGFAANPASAPAATVAPTPPPQPTQEVTAAVAAAEAAPTPPATAAEAPTQPSPAAETVTADAPVQTATPQAQTAQPSPAPTAPVQTPTVPGDAPSSWDPEAFKDRLANMGK